MKKDERLRMMIHAAADDCFSGIERMPSHMDAVMNQIHGGRSGAGRKRPAVLAFAALMTLVLAATVVAAGLGVFGRIGLGLSGEANQERLARLEEAAVPLNRQSALSIPGSAGGEKAQSVRERLLASQLERKYDLTVDQVYCDGRKLYYAYTFSMEGERLELYEGEATGFEPWDEARAGERFEDGLGAYLDEETARSIAEFFGAHEKAYAVINTAYVADGAQLPDGTYLTPIDSGDERTEDGTVSAFYEVELPEGYLPGEEIGFELIVATETVVYAQDEKGAYMSRLYDPRTQIRVPVTAPVTGTRNVMTGRGEADGYPAEAELRISDVDAVATVKIIAPEDYNPEGYSLLADGVKYSDVDMRISQDGETHIVEMRFDLPESLKDAKLVPLDEAYAFESIELEQVKGE